MRPRLGEGCEHGGEGCAINDAPGGGIGGDDSRIVKAGGDPIKVNGPLHIGMKERRKFIEDDAEGIDVTLTKVALLR